MKRIAGLGLLVALALVQVTWAPRLSIAGAFPNLVLIAVVAISWVYGVRSALGWACVGGVLLDLTSSGAVGPHALALVTCAYVTSLWVRNFEKPSALHAALTAAAGTVGYSLTLLLVAGLLGAGAIDSGAMVRLVIAAAVYNAALTPLALEVVRRVRAVIRESPEPA